MIRSFRIVIYYNHVEKVAVPVLHVTSFLDDVFQLLLLRKNSVSHTFTYKNVYAYLPYTLRRFGFSFAAAFPSLAARRKRRRASSRTFSRSSNFAGASLGRKFCRSLRPTWSRPAKCRSRPSRIHHARRTFVIKCPPRTALGLWNGNPARPLPCLFWPSKYLQIMHLKDALVWRKYTLCPDQTQLSLNRKSFGVYFFIASTFFY